jgi:hypothetical protein
MDRVSGSPAKLGSRRDETQKQIKKQQEADGRRTASFVLAFYPPDYQYWVGSK